MQTVVMSFARGLYLDKPELPIDHVHVYFPVQIVHKVIAQCEALKLQEGSLAAAERYRHNVDNAANNPYVIVGVFEGRCSREQYPPIPKTPIPRVRTPCGHGAQVIVEGREEQSDGGEKNEDTQTNQNKQTTAHRPSLHHLVVFPLC